MNYPLIIVIISITVWFFPLFKQYKTDYFYFFLILALSDIVKIISFYLLRINPQVFSLTFAFLLTSSLLSNRKQKYFFVILSILTFIIFLNFSMNRSILILSLIVTHFIIALILVLSLIKYIQKVKAVNLFLILLITYEYIDIIKFVTGLLNNEQGGISFYLATFTQIFFGLLFSFITFTSKDFPLFVKK